MLQDIRWAIRLAIRNRALTLVIVLSLALGIGANTTIFTLINAVFLRPLPVRDPERLVQVFTVMAKSAAYQSLSLANYRDFRDHVSELSGLAAWRSVGVNMVGGSEPLGAGGQLVTGNYFQVLGVEAARGRTFTPDEDTTAGDTLMVISDALWARGFGSDPTVVGKTVTLNRVPFTVIGVMPPGFKGVQTLGGVEFWVPLATHEHLLTGDVETSFFTTRAALAFQVIGRMQPGVSLDHVRQAMKRLARSLEEQYPKDNEGRSVEVFPLTETAIAGGPQGRDNLVRSGGLLLAATGLVLLIACGNVASLLLARAVPRRREIALRLSVGAARSRIVRQLLAESAALAVMGGLGGIALTFWGRDLLWALRPTGMRTDFIDLSVEPRVLWFTIALSTLTGMLFGLLPAIRGSQVDLVTAFKTQSDTRSRGSAWMLGLDLRSALVAGQIALSLVALVGAGLLLRSLQEAQRLELGFRSDNLIVTSINTGSQGYSRQRGLQFYRDAVERVRALPGVESVSWGEAVPQFSGQAVSRRVFPEGRELPPELLSLFVPFNGIFPGYFSAVGIPILKGRDFTDADREGAALVAIINETTAGLFWPGQDPVGKRFKHRLNPNFYMVVGVARDAQYNGLGGAAQPHLYYAALQYHTPAMTLAVRTSGDPEPVLPMVSQVIRQLDATMPRPLAVTMTEVLRGNLWRARMGAALLAVFALLALTLTCVGIYGVMAYSVTQRTKEIGIRMALGAEHTRVLRMILSQSVKLTSLGVAIGLVVALATTRLIASLLFVSPTDLWTFAGVGMLLAGVALFASYLPARRAARVDPLVALRYE
jgi:macrolide transport system ATP-binding/permease protein